MSDASAMLPLPKALSSAPPSSSLQQSANGADNNDEASMEANEGRTKKDKLLHKEKLKQAQEERMRKYETTTFGAWPEYLKPVLPPASERTYKDEEIGTLVYRDTAAVLQRHKVAVYSALVFDAETARPYFESKDRMHELAQRLADRLLPLGRILPSEAEVARVETWLRVYAEALNTPTQMDKIRNTVRLHAHRSTAGKMMLKRFPIAEPEQPVAETSNNLSNAPGDVLGAELGGQLKDRRKKRPREKGASVPRARPTRDLLASSPPLISLGSVPVSASRK